MDVQILVDSAQGMAILLLAYLLFEARRAVNELRQGIGEGISDPEWFELKEPDLDEIGDITYVEEADNFVSKYVFTSKTITVWGRFDTDIRDMDLSEARKHLVEAANFSNPRPEGHVMVVAIHKTGIK